MYIVPVWVIFGVSMMVGCPVQQSFPLCTLSCWDRLWPTRALNWKKQVKKELSGLFLLISLKCLCSSHLLKCLVLEAFWILIKNFGDVFVTKNMQQKLNSLFSTCLFQVRVTSGQSLFQQLKAWGGPHPRQNTFLLQDHLHSDGANLDSLVQKCTSLGYGRKLKSQEQAHKNRENMQTLHREWPYTTIFLLINIITEWHSIKLC